MNRWLAVVPILVIVGMPALAPATAMAVEPPQVSPGPPPVGPVAPLVPTEQRTQCAAGAQLPGGGIAQRPPADVMLDLRGALAFSRGAGQRVAVIDTGVTPNARLTTLEPGGDYVTASDGLFDCDAHGTLIAGLIAAAPRQGDDFAGVAPDAAILSIRQFSSAYSEKGSSPGRGDDPSGVSPGYGNTVTLALAVTRAVDMGATVINLSMSACAPVGVHIDDGDLGRALRYAFERNVVTVAAAGDVDSQRRCGPQNEVRDPNLPVDESWESVSTVASPAWFRDYVLTVGAVAADGSPSPFSLRGPWIDVAAPGEAITSLNPNGSQLSNALLDPQRGPVPISGTGYAAALVSGVVALVRSRYPEMSAAQVVERIERTARTPGAGRNAATGFGVVDPRAALTFELASADRMSDPRISRRIAPPPPSAFRNTRARDVAVWTIGGCLAIALVAAGLTVAVRRRLTTDHSFHAAEPRE